MSFVADDGLAREPLEVPRVRVERARRDDDTVVDRIIDMDLKSFLEPTFSRQSAAVLLGHGETFLLLDGEQVVGSCVTIRGYADPREAHVVSMAVLPGWRGRGLGRQFLTEVMDGLASDGFRGVSLLVESTNLRALRVYREAGFRTVRESTPDDATATTRITLRAPLTETPRA